MDINISNKWPRKTWSQLEQSLHPHISDVGADYFARALRSGSNLTNLNLADQRVRDKGAKMLFRALVPSRLRVLSLKKNELTDKCCIALKDCLYTNPNLEKLTLSGNAIGDLGCALIAKSLVRNQVLQALDISDNNVNYIYGDIFSTTENISYIEKEVFSLIIIDISQVYSAVFNDNDVVDVNISYTIKDNANNTNIILRPVTIIRAFTPPNFYYYSLF